MNQLPGDKAEEISDFADFVRTRHEEKLLTQGIEKLSADGVAFAFLYSEEELYSMADLKDVYGG